jgi:eukaryotic-like serine/threonine-protein kinase
VAQEVVLRQRWALGAAIGDPSGFGRVFEAEAEDGTAGVVKFIPKQPGADRELLFEELSGVPNVVPILETGETTDAWLIAMPKADSSLRAVLRQAGGAMPESDVVPVLIDIARALAALDGRVVHRDLKPENVLRLNGSWCLADFGIARYAQASTAPDTWKFAWSPPYNAPERWRNESATSASDVYSLGVMAHEMLAGQRPFPGPGVDDLRDQHLHRDAPDLAGVSPSLASLVAECLFKSPGSRAAPANLLTRLERSLAAPSAAAARLQAANAAIRVAQARDDAVASAATTEKERRAALLADATRVLEHLGAGLQKAILDNAPAAARDPRSRSLGWALGLGTASIRMEPARPTPASPWGQFAPAFDVIANSEVGISIPEDRYDFNGREHSLWYCDAQQDGVYRWYEIAFMVAAMIPRTTKTLPFAFDPSENAGKALWRGMAEWQLARPFVPVDQGDEDAFIERWLEWFALAAEGNLRRPSSMPEGHGEGSFRR